MNNVHNDCNAIGMCFIDKFFKFFRCTKARAGCKKRTYMIAKTPIIGVFLNCHNLNSIVAFFYYSRQYVLFKFSISTNFLSILPHSDVAFVNKKWRFVWFKGLMFPLIFFFRTPYLSREYFCSFILNNSLCPCGDTFAFSPIPQDIHLKQVAMMYFLFIKH